jgi:hypothetical protein
VAQLKSYLKKLPTQVQTIALEFYEAVFESLLSYWLAAESWGTFSCCVEGSARGDARFRIANAFEPLHRRLTSI